MNGAKIKLVDIVSDEKIYEGSLKDLLSRSLIWKAGEIHTALNFTDEPALLIAYGDESIQIPLSGSSALRHLNLSTPYLGRASLVADISCNPKLLAVQDSNRDVDLFAFDLHGRVFRSHYSKSSFESLIAYDDGYLGYAVVSTIPLKTLSRAEQEAETLNFLKKQLNEHRNSLSPPLQLLQKASLKTNVDFAAAAINFLNLWDKKRGLILKDDLLDNDLSPVIQAIDSSSLSEIELKSLKWTATILEGLETDLRTLKI